MHNISCKGSCSQLPVKKKAQKLRSNRRQVGKGKTTVGKMIQLTLSHVATK
jgi:hypothetical protein